MRNFSMAIVIPLMATLFHREPNAGSAKSRPKHQLFPPFVIGFLAFTVLRTVGDASPQAFGVVPHALWAQFLALMDHGSTWFLTVVMAAVGLSTALASLKKLGLRPFFVGLTAALTVGSVGYAVIKLLAAFSF